MAVQDSAASEQSPLLPPPRPLSSSSTIADESGSTASENSPSDPSTPPSISVQRGVVLGVCIAVLIFLLSEYDGFRAPILPNRVFD